MTATGFPAQNRTPEDAFIRVRNAQISAHADATDTYLLELRAQLHGWIQLIDTELAQRIRREREQQEAAEL